jgi:hypothetical protein
LNLLDKSTFWIFISGSDEDSHVEDIIFGLSCLEKRGVSPDRIAVFIDKSDRWIFIDESRFSSKITINSTYEITDILNSQITEKVVVFVTGHGNENGIKVLEQNGEDYEIKPYQLIKLVQNINGLQSGLIILGQCYAGTFNFLNLESSDTGQPTPEISIIGATDLQVSINATFSPDDPDEIDTSNNPLNNNLVNIFLTCFMYYVASPKDIDGDGIATVLDIYKAALVKSNKILIKVKRNALLDMHEHYAFTSDMKKYPWVTHKNAPETEKILDKAEKDYNEKSAILLSTQNSWILNVDLARRLTF